MDAGEPAYRENGSCLGATDYMRKVSLDDRTLGHSARDIADAFARNGPGLLQWFDGSVTMIRMTADISQAGVTIEDSPPYQGHCTRFIWLANVSFTVTSADGRLDDTGIGSLIADDAGGPVLAIWLELNLAMDELRGSLRLPEAWNPIEPGQERLYFLINSKENLTSPYCHEGEVRDETPDSECTNWGGKITCGGHGGRGLVAWWKWL